MSKLISNALNNFRIANELHSNWIAICASEYSLFIFDGDLWSGGVLKSLLSRLKTISVFTANNQYKTCLLKNDSVPTRFQT